MNAWPTLREWFQFGGTLALELVIVFAVAKLVALRVRSAQGRRALWQISLLAMLLVVAGELNGVRGWLRLPEKKASLPVEKKVVVTLLDVEPDLEWFRDSLIAEAAPLATAAPKPAPRPLRWQQHAVWPALIWAMVAALILFRILIAQVMALALRFASRRSSGQPCPLNTNTTEGTADMAVRSSEALASGAQRIAQSLGIRRQVALLTNARAVAPFTFGVWRPVIVLPTNFSETFTPEQQDAALAHELAHVAGFDSAWRCFSQFACAMLWWHPLVWLAKRELDHVSELVADEASLLLADGPDRLAECLVACAKELRRPALTTWLGMDGGGFRSALGRRVERLLQLGPHSRLSRPVPWYLRLIAPLVGTALLWLGTAMVMKSDEPRGGAWRSSILGSAFAAVAESAEVKRVAPVATTTNSLTASNLSDIPPLFGRLFSNQEPSRAGAGLQMSAKRQQIYNKLRSIRLSEWGPLDSLPLREVIHSLFDATREIDPQHKGVNFLLSPETDPKNFLIDGSVPLMPPEKDVGATSIRLGIKLYNLSVEEVLNIVMKIAERRIKYSVEDYGVLISPAGNEPTPMHTRFFRMDTNDFQRVLQSVPRELTNASAKAPDDVPFGRRVDSELTNRVHFLTEVTPAEVVTPRVRNWLKSLGVELTEPGQAVFFNDKLGMLMIRATLEDLDVIEKALQPFGIKPGATLKAGRATSGEPSNISEQDRIEAAKLVQDGKLYYETGQLEAARTNLQAALRLHPANQGALYYLAQLNKIEAAPNQAPEANATNLQTRFFSVDPKTLEQGLKSISTQGGGGRGGSGERKPLFNPNDTNSVIERVQRLFQAAGVDLSAPGRALVYQDRVGVVMVRATPAELDTVEKAVQLLNMTPPQLTIRVKVLEVERKSGQSLGSDWFLGTLVTNQFFPKTLKAVSPVARSGVNFPGINDAIPSDQLTSGLRTRAPDPTNATITGILTDEQFRKVIKTLESRGGTDLLSAPEVTTMSGRQAQIKIVDIQYIVTDMNYSAFTTNTTSGRKPSGNISGADDGLNSLITPIAQPFEIGPVIDVVPYVEADGYTITMTVLPTMREFLGYDDPGDFSITVSNRVSQKTLTQPVPLPKFRLRQTATTARIWDGQTLMIGAGSARTMQRDRAANGVLTTNYTEKELIYFITPRLIDPAGNPLHADDEFPERHKTVPAQRKPE